MKKGLVYALPMLVSTACSNSSDETSAKPIDCVLQPHQETLQPYYNFLYNHEQVVEAAGFCQFSQELQERIWDKIQEAEETGLPPTAPLPAAYQELLQNGPGTSPEMYTQASPYQFSEQLPAEYLVRQWRNGKLEEKIVVLLMDAKNYDDEAVTVIYATKEEAYEIYAAQLADKLWKEVNNIFPWSITEYHQEQLEQLLQPRAWFRSWDDQKGEYYFHLILDHSPRETFEVAIKAVRSFSDQRAAMDDIIKSARPFRHGVVKLDSDGNIIDSDPRDIVTIPTMNEKKISRHGCQTMSPYVVALTNSLNIPGKFVNGYYATGGHRSAWFEFTDDVLAHGDDVYHYNYLGNTPSSEVMGSHDFWEKNVLTYKKEDKTAAHNSMIYTYRKAVQYPANRLIYDYCTKGKDHLNQIFLEGEFGPFTTGEEINALEDKILKLSHNCTEPFPENSPDQ